MAILSAKIKLHQPKNVRASRRRQAVARYKRRQLQAIRRLPHPMKNRVRNDAEGNSECIKILPNGRNRLHQVRDDAER
jgi:hypothetical protein